MSDGGQSIKDVSFVKVDFVPDPGQDFQLIFDGLKGTEELGQPFFYELDMTSGKLVGDVTKLIGASATVTLKQSDDSDTKYLNGVVTRVVSEGLARGTYSYRIELRPWLWLLTRTADCRIFQNKSAFDIITGLFRDAGFSDFQDKRQNSSGSTQLDYCVQYRESTFDFSMRLMEQFGIYYFFTHDDGKHTLVFADDPNSHTELTDKIPFQFDTTEMRTVKDHIWEWTSDFSLHSGKFTARDYNFTTPTADLTSKTVKTATYQHPDYEVFEYPGLYTDTSEGQSFTDVAMQAIVADRQVFHGSSNCRKLHAGWKFKLDKYKDTSLNKAYLIKSAEIAISLAEGLATTEDQGEAIDTYRVILRAIPGDVPFRLHRKTPRPMIRGPQTAVVVGSSGDEIYTDQYARIKVKFFWDRAEVSDEDRTCWIRVSQPWAGGSFGAMVIPRVGMEVVVEFLEGNPDRPIITGVVYNANQQVPYSLPGDKNKTSFKTNSTKGGGGFNELRFDDTKGSEEVFFQAQYDYNKKVLNNETVTVTKDTTTTVQQGNRSVTVSKGNDSLTVSTGNNSVTVSTGDHSVTVSTGKSSITATTSITLTSGGSSIQISPSGITISAPQISATADASMSLDGGGTMSLTAGMISIN